MVYAIFYFNAFVMSEERKAEGNLNLNINLKYRYLRLLKKKYGF